jgi:hypothetical protein
VTEPSEYSGFFAADYGRARAGFLAAAVRAEASLTHHRNPRQGPSGEALFTDVAVLGPRDAQQLFIVTSGVHGVEGFCGSACQIALLESGIAAAATSATVVLVHALNPYGFAHLRRTNEDNVDLNRNFIDHAHPPANPDYAALHPLLVPADWDGPLHLKAEQQLLAAMVARGVREVYSAASRGQYDHSDGVFYGGRGPAWSNTVWREILAELLPRRTGAVHLDLHTGLGRYGYGEAIYVGAANTPGCHALRACLSEPLVAIFDGAAVAPRVDGPIASAVHEAADGAEVIPFALEFGTLGLPPVLRAMRADAWLNGREDQAGPLAQSLRAEVRAAFNIDADVWRSMVVDQALRHGREVIDALNDGALFGRRATSP